MNLISSKIDIKKEDIINRSRVKDDNPTDQS